MESRGAKPLRILDKKGFIKVQRDRRGKWFARRHPPTGALFPECGKKWPFSRQMPSCGPTTICVGARVMDFNGTGELEQIPHALGCGNADGGPRRRGIL